MITAAQIRAARALIKVSAQEMSNETGLGISTIQRMENRGTHTSTAANVETVRRYLISNGIEFINTKTSPILTDKSHGNKAKHSSGEGVRLLFPSNDIENIGKEMSEAGFYVSFEGGELPNSINSLNIFYKLSMKLTDCSFGGGQLTVLEFLETSNESTLVSVLVDHHKDKQLNEITEYISREFPNLIDFDNLAYASRYITLIDPPEIVSDLLRWIP